MKLGLVSDSLGGMDLDAMLDNAARTGVDGIEVNTCGWSTAPHFDLAGLLGNASAQRAYKDAYDARGLEKSVSLLQGVMPVAPLDYKPQDI